ncbi:MAG: helix-turn-helix domain-containing protein [Hungatella sp.]|nr:helix-turn-helix domain-containing protein [Hungatella sp.]
MLNQYGDIITIPELCEVLMIGRNRAYELLKTGQIPAFQLGRNWKIPKIALEEYLKKQAKVQSYSVSKEQL